MSAITFKILLFCADFTLLHLVATFYSVTDKVAQFSVCHELELSESCVLTQEQWFDQSIKRESNITVFHESSESPWRVVAP